VLTVNPLVPAKTVQELISLVKANPGKYSYASPGTGTTGQLAGELFRISLGLDLTHVPFNGAAPAITSTIGGHTGRDVRRPAGRGIQHQGWPPADRASFAWRLRRGRDASYLAPPAQIRT
jgi:hypothetical protein